MNREHFNPAGKVSTEAYTVTVPILVNTKTLVADERLILKWHTIKRLKPKTNTNEKTWLDAYKPKGLPPKKKCRKTSKTDRFDSRWRSGQMTE